MGFERPSKVQQSGQHVFVDKRIDRRVEDDGQAEDELAKKHEVLIDYVDVVSVAMETNSKHKY